MQKGFIHVFLNWIWSEIYWNNKKVKEKQIFYWIVNRLQKIYYIFKEKKVTLYKQLNGFFKKKIFKVYNCKAFYIKILIQFFKLH